MNHTFTRALRLATAACLVGYGFTSQAAGSEGNQEQEVLSRLFFQDDEARTIRWADLYSGASPTLGPIQEIAGFPPLDAESQSLVQMESIEGLLLVGVRDSEGGTKQSGWILIDAGVESEEHGDHRDYFYSRKPRVRAVCLDEKQGNPAHLYVYDQVFYLANDKLAGYTRLDPAGIRPADKAAAILAQAEFIPGGSGHITLAAVDRKVGYSTWIDREGKNRGRVDVTSLAKRKIGYSLHLPHGGLHGATANSGKVFFAPVDGICWLQADLAAAAEPAKVQIQHLSLGKHPQSDKPLRTGSFTNLGKHVLFVAGDGPSASLQMVNAAAQVPVMHKLPLNMAVGARPAGLEAEMLVGDFPMALIFHEHAAESDAEHQVSLVELDPNLDGDYRDARVGKVLKVGRSKVSGHAGHHAAAFLPNRRHVVYTNPGDGTLGILRIRRLEMVAEIQVGGVPTKIEAIGGPSGH